MENTTTDLLYNGQKIRYVFIDEELYLDVNSICNAIGVDVETEVEYAKANFTMAADIFKEDMFIDHLGNLNTVTLISQMYCIGWMPNIKGENIKDRYNAYECHKAIWDFFYKLKQ